MLVGEVVQRLPDRFVRHRFGAQQALELEADQRDLLSAIGIEEDQEMVAAKQAAEAKPKVSRADPFQLHLAALAEFVEREGHVRVPRPHKTGEGLPLGAWLNNTKARRDKLSAEQVGQLAEHGVEWA